MIDQFAINGPLGLGVVTPVVPALRVTTARPLYVPGFAMAITDNGVRAFDACATARMPARVVGTSRSVSVGRVRCC